MGRDELGDCGDGIFFFLRSGDDDIGIWGVCSSFAPKLEFGVRLFFFVRGSVNGSPTASVLGSFFIENTEPVSDWCWSFEDKSVLLLVSTPPLQMFEVEINGD